MKSFVKNILQRYFPYWEIKRDFEYDFKRYVRHSFKSRRPITDQQLMFRLLQRAHSFEKGFSLPNVKRGFGIKKMKELISLVKEYQQRSLPLNQVEYQKALSAIHTYRNFHGDQLPNFPDIEDLLSEAESGYFKPSIKKVRKREILQAADGDFASLAASRCSVRQFSNEPVHINKIKEAVVIAQKTPSVCNRQAGHVILVKDNSKKRAILDLQNGNRGFTEEINQLLIITASIECFEKGNERNQAFIDGGLFAMSLMYALHYKHLATCPLNWSANRHKDEKLRKLIDIPVSHAVIMLLGVGNFKEEFVYATSPRRALSDVFLER